MRSIRVDQFEFPHPGSEESLEIDVSRQSEFPHPDVRSFVASVVGVDAAATLPTVQPYNQVPECDTVSAYLRQFADIDVAPHCDWPTYVFHREWDELHMIIGAPNLFIRYQWSTAA